MLFIAENKNKTMAILCLGSTSWAAQDICSSLPINPFAVEFFSLLAKNKEEKVVAGACEEFRGETTA